MPSRVYASLLRCQPSNRKGGDGDVSMPSRAVTSFLLRVYDHETSRLEKVSMPSRADTSFLHYSRSTMWICGKYCVNALSGWYLISTRISKVFKIDNFSVSIPSRASTSFLPFWCLDEWIREYPVSMPSRASTSFLRWMACWFSLLEGRVNALTG